MDFDISDAEVLYQHALLYGRLNRYEERIVSESPEYACAYALKVLKGRFHIAEATIGNHAFFSYKYARYVMKRRFPLGELAISKHGTIAFWYARDIIKGRFLMGERAIFQTTLANSYCRIYSLTLPEQDWSRYGF